MGNNARMTEADLRHLLRNDPDANPELAKEFGITADSNAIEPEVDEAESVLQRDAEDYCRRCGWRYFHMKYPQGNMAGLPDLLVWAKGGFEMFEFKSKKGRLSSDQKKFIEDVKALGHEVHVIKTMEQFINIMKRYRR